MRVARDLGVKILGIRSVILFESLNPVVNPFPPFWFNIADLNSLQGYMIIRVKLPFRGYLLAS